MSAPGPVSLFLGVHRCPTAFLFIPSNYLFFLACPRPFVDWRPWVWDVVIVDEHVAAHLNASVYAPIASHFPAVHFSNFAHFHHTDARGACATQAGRSAASDARTGQSADCAATCSSGAWWPWAADSSVSPLGAGSHAGTHQSTSFYGGRPFERNARTLQSQKQARGHLPCRAWFALLSFFPVCSFVHTHAHCAVDGAFSVGLT